MNTANHETMSTILLSGSLAKLFGRTHQRIIGPTREAFTALSATIPGFQNFMNASKARGLTFAVFVDKKNIVQDDLDFPNCGRTIRIVPVIMGSKRAGVLQTILGAVMVVVGAIGAFTPWGQALGGAAWGSYMMQAGGALIAGGVIQMLSPQAAGLASKQSADNQASYAFGGVTNTAAQGYPVPLLYGRRRIGGAIISAGIYVEDQQ
ncbi:lambda tail assembly I [Enterobacter asburiae]|uniref:tail assembly protein n=1 Tax=Enterobacter asburiae TaxID=61645 RepID=UPI0005ED7225|nr:tail assembly protein [Enterobacter asburiae]KJP14024.1 phage tail assembly protein [Enterobacter asburiae]KOQ91374.1 phage tail assembly protein [Enterobacter asburiae]CZW66690.1 lambda tail assembly I [Enterobacter asburiae]